MSGNNGDKMQPTKAELKRKAFESNPDNFVCLDDLILAAQRCGDEPVETLVAPSCREELEIALSRITHKCYGIFNAMSHAAQEANKSKIVKSGGFFSGRGRR